jgi:hydrogenase expression/formation protein HypE
VHVNANDVACMGARPAWFLATILLPEGAPERLARDVFGQVVKTCEQLGIALVGGHTEITHGLERPIVSGALLGEVERERLVQPERARPGDALILTKGIAIEGTCLLAREAEGRLRGLGVPDDVLERARGYLTKPGISVVRDAATLCDSVPVHALHDPTEGGLATALYELAAACGAGVAVDGDAVEVLPETRAVCEAAGLDPLGLLASGALLAAVPEYAADAALQALAGARIPARRIGTLVARSDGVIIEGDNLRQAVPTFSRDEVARFFSEAD